SGACGNALTNSASLSVNQPTLISSAPANVTTCSGSGASFNVSATGTDLSYQWFKAAMLLPGQTNSTLVLANVSTNDAAIYSVVVSGACGNALTNSASLG